MRITRIVPAALVVIALAGCGTQAPTAAEPATPRFNGGGAIGTGGPAGGEGGIMSTGTTPPLPGDSTQIGGNDPGRGGWIGSGT